MPAVVEQKGEKSSFTTEEDAKGCREKEEENKTQLKMKSDEKSEHEKF